ncbi:MAG TPA: radical SAM protein [Methanomassiliicoccales archaeon]|nr:radical SAM protein [Methanomassiliicoccales archaeon]
MREKLGTTRSLCPECLKTIPAEKWGEDDDAVYLEKECPDHGKFRTIIWRGIKDYKDLTRYACQFNKPLKVAVQEKDRCPEVCGLCPDHVQNTCLVVMEITNSCNLKCPICFASANEKYKFHPSLDEIKKMYQTMLEYVNHPICVQISGGEPTIRDDLPDIIKLGKSMGIDHIELNTNGVRFAQDIEFLKKCKDAGVDSLYFSFDGLKSEIYMATCGKDLLQSKLDTIKNCAKVGMGVTLVCVVSPNINLQYIGDIIKFAKENVPTIKGIHFQPIAYFGRFPIIPRDLDRVTIPDLLNAIEKQTKGELRADNFIPTSCSNVHCDAKSMSVILEDGSMFPLTSRALGPPRETQAIATKTRKEISDLWRFIEEGLNLDEDTKDNTWGSFIERAKTHYLTVSTMAFQDAWNVETERLCNCCIHTITPDGKLIPFCLFNINGGDGRTLYRHEMWSRHSVKP